MATWITGQVTKVINWTDSLFSIIVDAPINPFTAGQYAKLALEINGERVQRAYSYVNAPDDKNLEFYLVKSPEGKLSSQLFALKPDDELLITKDAAGFFMLEEIPECQTLWMLATGTAIGPYLSILQQDQNLARFRNIVLVYAVRFAADLSYFPLMQQLKQRLQGKLQIQTVVSRETVAGSLTGRIPTFIQNGELENITDLQINPEISHVMLCGNPQMVRDTQQLLQQTRQMRKHFRRKPGHISSELYW